VVVLDIDNCASFPCGFDNDCFDKVNGYDCSCTAGYVLDNTSTRCIGLTRTAHNQTAKRCHVISINVNFIMQVQQFGGSSRKMFTLGKIWADFTKLQTLIANYILNESRYLKSERRERFLPRSMKEVRWTLVHYPESRTCEFAPTQVDFFRETMYFGP